MILFFNKHEKASNVMLFFCKTLNRNLDYIEDGMKERGRIVKDRNFEKLIEIVK